MKNVIQKLLDRDERTMMPATLVSDDFERTRKIRHSIGPLGFPDMAVISFSIAAVEIHLNTPVLLLIDIESEELDERMLFSLIYQVRENYPDILIIVIASEPSAKRVFSLLSIGIHGVFLPPFSPEGLEELFRMIQRGVTFGEVLLGNQERNEQLAQLILEELLRLHSELTDESARVGEIERSASKYHLECMLKMTNSFKNYYDEGTKNQIRDVFKAHFSA